MVSACWMTFVIGCGSEPKNEIVAPENPKPLPENSLQRRGDPMTTTLER
jgi:hypothetical protein